MAYPYNLFNHLLIALLSLSSLTHAYKQLNEKSLGWLSTLSQPDRLSVEGELLKPLLIPRVSGTQGNADVRDFLASKLRELNWHVELDNFTDNTPLGEKLFTNIIATKNPDVPKRFVLAAHFDSKYFEAFEFIGATDSAVPCALLLDLAQSLDPYLDSSPKKDTTLQLVFFDGEEAFVQWSATDSTYGSRHLAAKWESTFIVRPDLPQRKATNLLNGIEVMMLLDLLGSGDLKDSKVPNYFASTSWLFGNLAALERRLWTHSLFTGEPDNLEEEVYFNVEGRAYGGIDDDHVPFLIRGVPILHIIPVPFPKMWHTVK
ncbi:hypothetical protein BC936DRAFT_145885, partial [Jimgerdemannia flammicorona]